MTQTTLTPEQVSEVLARAQEIEQTLGVNVDLTSDISSVISAAEEAGVSREAITQAIKEHTAVLWEPLEAGDLVFAKSVSGTYFVAEVVRHSDAGIRVQFLSGGEITLAPKDLRPFTVVPGTQLICNWPHWGLWTCTVLSYNASARIVRVTDNWGSEESFPIAEVQLNIRQFEPKPPGALERVNWTMASLFAAGGGIVGSALTWFFTHR